jgi:predicted transcriptional regulator
MKKDKVINTVKDLPEEFELDELLEKLIFIEKVDMGLAQVEQGKVIAHENVKEIVKQW